MIKYENECVDCGLYCLGKYCPMRNVRHLYCDVCEIEASKLYKLDGQELCEDCATEILLEDLEVIE